MAQNTGDGDGQTARQEDAKQQPSGGSSGGPPGGGPLGGRRPGMRWTLLGAGAGAAALAAASIMQAPEEPGVDDPAPPELALSGEAVVEPPWRRFAVKDDDAADPRLQSVDARPLISLVIAPYEGSLEGVEAIDAPIAVVLPAGGEAAHAARARGHEALLDLASAGRAGHAARDAAAALEARVQSGVPPVENDARLRRKIALGDGFVGVAIIGDAQAAGDPKLLRTVYRRAAEEGLLVFDGRASNESRGYLIRGAVSGPSATAQVVVDAERRPEAMAEALAAAEALAGETGSCVAFAEAHPDTLAAIRSWLGERDRTKARLAPLTALVGADLRK